MSQVVEAWEAEHLDPPIIDFRRLTIMNRAARTMEGMSARAADSETQYGARLLVQEVGRLALVAVNEDAATRHMAPQAIEALAQSPIEADRAFAGLLLYAEHIARAIHDEAPDPSIEVARWDRLLDRESSSAVLTEHHRSLGELNKGLTAIDGANESVRPFSEAIYNFIDDRQIAVED